MNAQLNTYVVTRENFDEKEFERGFNEWYEKEGKSTIDNIYLNRNLAIKKYNEQMVLAQKMQIQVKELYTQANQCYEKSNQYYEKSKQLDTQSKEMKIEVEKERQEIANNRIEIAKKKQDILTKQFYSIFHGKNILPEEKIEIIFNKYLSDQSLTVEKSIEKNNYSKLNSMTAVIKYLDDNPNIKMIDFRILKTEINDIPTLAEYLSKSNIKGVAINSGISIEAKTSLNKAVEARNGGLKVQYFN